ncbi:hypothetical protein AVEN_110616-1 [Araneus ventricosus]|uniref:Uncharacterized protein n=1 Tax=Araneus ventricosus TaxID=182803 RepID=A0A4Y2AWM9_ARAVE|nr:hypothetical protein AVEN_110616-1 [Araneus ventricosus]
MTRTTPESGLSSNFEDKPVAQPLTFSASGPHIQRIFGEIGFRTWNPLPCSSNRFSCCHGIRHGDMGRRSVPKPKCYRQVTVNKKLILAINEI